MLPTFNAKQKAWLLFLMGATPYLYAIMMLGLFSSAPAERRTLAGCAISVS